MTLGGFRPHLAPTLITVPVVLVCLGLGAWQIQRLHWKEALIAQRAAALTAAPAAPPETLAEARRLEFHLVATEGVLLNDRETYLHAIGQYGAAGFDVLTPLREEDGRVVLVNRGFVPTELRDPATRLAGPDGIVRVTGRLRLPPGEKPGWFAPDNRPERGEWFWIDLAAIAAADRLAADGLTRVAPFYIDADATPNLGGWPKGSAGLPDLSNHHLQYAVTWFSLAAAAAVIYFLAQRGNSGIGDARDDDRIR
jgi:surfeit locus 1 family protein